MKFTRAQMQKLTLGPNYAIGLEPKQYTNELITVTKNAIRHLGTKYKTLISTWQPNNSNTS